MKTYGIDASALLKENPTGVEKYVLHLLTAMMKCQLLPDERVVLYAPRKKPEAFMLPQGWEWRELPFFLPKGWTHVRLSAELFLHPPSVFFSPAHEIPLLTGGSKIVSTVHDVAFRRKPSAYDGGSRRRQEWAMNRVRRKADRILAVSETTSRDLVELFSIDQARISVTPLAPTFVSLPSDEDVGRVLDAFRLSKSQYVLFVGRIEEKKNVRTLLSAFLQVKAKLGTGHPLTLVLAGSFGYRSDEVVEMARRSPYADDVRFLGYVPDSDVPPLLAGARAFVFPSVWEGFGLPLLEAMAVHTPVIASDIPVFREIGGEAAYYVKSDDTQAFVTALERAVFDQAFFELLAEKGDERVRQFSWDETATRTLAALRQLPYAR